MNRSSNGRWRVAILGGGTGAMSAAWYLTEGEAANRYEVTVYQMGWRLGGKGASGRNPDKAHRIEEHGLHVWGGFYDNSFQLMQRVYDELERHPGEPLASWSDAFKPHPSIAWMEEIDGRWESWPLEIPTNDAIPGTGGLLPTPWDYLAMTLQWLEAIVTDFKATDPAPLSPAWWLQEVEERIRAIGGDTFLGQFSHLPITQRLLRWAVSLIRLSPALPTPQLLTSVLWLFDAFWSRFEKLAADMVKNQPQLRRMFILADLGSAIVRGMLLDGVLTHKNDWDALNTIELTDWLRKHGATEMSLNSAPIRAYYSYFFAFKDGDTDKRSMCAGIGMRHLVRLVGSYKGSLFWKMQAGMGDVVFAPLYLALKKRGVRFKFLSRIDNLGLSPDNRCIDRIQLTQQATPLHRGGYDPLYDVKGLPCWPNRPLWDRIKGGKALQDAGADLENPFYNHPDMTEHELLRGRDFDDVVLNISLGSIPYVGKELLKARPAWQKLVDGIQPIQTQAFQLWLKPDREALGWQAPATLMTAHAHPTETWADLTHLLERECWENEPQEERPENIAYFCGPMKTNAPPDAINPASETKRAVDNTRAYLAQHTRNIWPEATKSDTNALDYNHLVAEAGSNAEQRFDQQYVRANWSPSERYVISPPNTEHLRFPADHTGFDNLYVAGDWVETGLGGCIEAAVIAGKQCARAIRRIPLEIVGEKRTPSQQGMPRQRCSGPGEQRARTARARELPQFLARGGEQQFLHPFTQENAQLYGFALQADLNALEILVDKHFNDLTGNVLHYKPLLPMVMLTWVPIQKIPSVEGYGWLQETDVAFWIVLGRYDKKGNLEQISAYNPYMFVDNPWTLITGREVFGYGKAFGEFQYPTSPTDPAVFSCKTMQIQTYDPDTQAEHALLVEAKRLDETFVGEPSVLWGNSAADVVQAILSNTAETLVGADIDYSGFARELWEFARDRSINQLFLKQFRDIEDGTRACYQAVTEAPAQIDSIAKAGLLPGKYRVTLHNSASHNVQADLGLDTDAGEIEPLFASQVNMTFTVKEGTVLWEA